ncbi:ABC transporter ATP-binding protein [Chitinimonas lacunae]|uniref:ABC transporter ATP-binding protein n=1 Tax=Chitinimonas lacunae TaxID=1963018 RepID=A0ABV8MPB7_9NEIS
MSTELLDHQGKATPCQPTATGALLTVQHLSRWHRSEGQRLAVLDHVSLHLLPAETVALFGPSGSGKSTLLNLLALLDRPDQGEIHFEGRRIDNASPAEAEWIRARRLGVIFQSFNLIPSLSALENVEIALLAQGGSRIERRSRAVAMLERVGLGDRLGHRPSQLSGGQQQRVGVARALCKRPALVLADEPSANLDSQSAQALFGLMRELASEVGTTFLVATHDPRLVQQADRTLELRDGRLVT